MSLDVTHSAASGGGWMEPDGTYSLPLHDLLANLGGAGEAQFAHIWVVRQTLAHHGPCVVIPHYIIYTKWPVKQGKREGIQHVTGPAAQVLYLPRAGC